MHFLTQSLAANISLKPVDHVKLADGLRVVSLNIRYFVAKQQSIAIWPRGYCGFAKP